MPEPRYAGVPVDLGGTVYTVPPLAMRAVRTLLPKIQSIEFGDDGLPREQDMDVVFEILHAAIRRNYPELGLEEFIDAIDVVSFGPLVEAVFAGSGFAKVARGPEGNGSGAPARSTGMPSTPASAPPSAGPGSTSTSA